ncbi:MAG: beta-lactamase family protein [Eubacteriales bacterium]|nr:beta-lactamase family protein [Eubacteriales bacterium]
MMQKEIQGLEQTIHSQYSNIAGMVVQKNGKTLYEGYLNGYTAGNAAHVYSVTKSVFSVLIGIAVDRGDLESLDRKVLDFFPDYAVKTGERTIQKVTIRNLLTMTAPYKYDTEPYEMFFASQNPIRDALDLLGGEKPVGEFHYSAIGGTHILSGILAKATGKSVLAFAAEHLFAPLGISVLQSITLKSAEEHFAVMNDRNTRGWVVDPQGNSMASWGLFLTPAEMAAIGQLYLDGGTWNGKQIVSKKWIAESTREQSRWGNLAYGYLWWVIGEGCFAALGDGGNVIYVNPKKGMVIAIVSLFVPDAKDRIEWIKREIEPMFEG